MSKRKNKGSYVAKSQRGKMDQIDPFADLKTMKINAEPEILVEDLEPEVLEPEVIVESLIPELVQPHKTIQHPKTPQIVQSEKIETGVICDIIRSETSNSIRLIKIATMYNGKPEIIFSSKRNLPAVNLQLNDQLNFQIIKFHDRNGKEKKTAIQVQLVNAGNKLMATIADEILKKTNTLLKTYSSQQLKALIHEYANTAKTVDEAIKQLETNFKLKFLGKSDQFNHMFVFELIK